MCIRDRYGGMQGGMQGGGYYPQPQAQPVYVQRPQGGMDNGAGAGCCACLTGMLACCCLEELCMGA